MALSVPYFRVSSVYCFVGDVSNDVQRGVFLFDVDIIYLA